MSDIHKQFEKFNWNGYSEPVLETCFLRKVSNQLFEIFRQIKTFLFKRAKIRLAKSLSYLITNIASDIQCEALDTTETKLAKFRILVMTIYQS